VKIVTSSVAVKNCVPGITNSWRKFSFIKYGTPTVGDVDGVAEGSAEGLSEGEWVGEAVGDTESDGLADGCEEGLEETVGNCDGWLLIVGEIEGAVEIVGTTDIDGN
jgi:hypothetical protein